MVGIIPPEDDRIECRIPVGDDPGAESYVREVSLSEMPAVMFLVLGARFVLR